jgi:hypothetical protein
MQDRAEGEDRISACILYLHTPWARFSKTSARYRVPGIGYLAPGTRDRISAEDRTPITEDRARPLENAHIGSASQILTKHDESRNGIGKVSVGTAPSFIPCCPKLGK